MDIEHGAQFAKNHVPFFLNSFWQGGILVLAISMTSFAMKIFRFKGNIKERIIGE